MIYKRKGVYYYGVKVTQAYIDKFELPVKTHGKQNTAWLRRSSGSNLKAVAREKQDAEQKLIKAGEPLEGFTAAPVKTAAPPEGLPALLEAFSSWKEKAGYSAGRFRDCSRHLLRHLGEPRADALTSEAVQNFVESRLQEKARPATVQTELRNLRAAYNWGIKQKRVAHNPTSGVTVKAGTAPRHRRISQAEFVRLFAALERDHIKEHVEVALHTALRLGELQRMVERDCDFHGETIWVPKSKNGAARSIPMHPRVREILWGRVQGIDNRRPFASPRNVGRPFRRAVKRAGLSNIRWHDLRHAAASHLFEAGADHRTVMQVGGWKDARTPLEIYAQVSPEHVRAAVHRLPNFAFESVPASEARQHSPSDGDTDLGHRAEKMGANEGSRREPKEMD